LDVIGGPAVVVSGPELQMLARQLPETIRLAYLVRGKYPPRALLDFSVAVNQAVAGTCGTHSAAFGAGQACPAEPRNSRLVPGARTSGKPVTLSVKEAAEATKVSESYLRRLVRIGVLERAGRPEGEMRVFADSLAAWHERRHRRETSAEAA
jgi:excisionase family DNA binding protein